jgi:Fe2+ transport system protein FeoA
VSEHRAVLVQNMIDKGFTPGEIVRVLEASDLNGPLPVSSRRHAERV